MARTWYSNKYKNFIPTLIVWFAIPGQAGASQVPQPLLSSLIFGNLTRQAATFLVFTQPTSHHLNSDSNMLLRYQCNSSQCNNYHMSEHTLIPRHPYWLCVELGVSNNMCEFVTMNSWIDNHKPDMMNTCPHLLQRR